MTNLRAETPQSAHGDDFGEYPTDGSGTSFRLSTGIFLGTLLAFVGIGIALRVSYVYSHYLWTDEVMTRFLVGMSWPDFVNWFTAGNDVHPPLYPLWLRIVELSSLGLSDMQTLRYVDLVWLPATLGVLLWAGMRRPEYRIALAVGGLALAVGPTFAYLGAEFRSYGLLTFLAVFLTALVARQLEGVAHTAVNVGLTAATVLSLTLTHYVGILIVAAILGSGFIIAIGSRRRPLLFVASGLLAIVAFIPYLPVFMMQLRNQHGVYSTPASDSLRFLLWGMGPVGSAVAALALFGSVIALVRRVRSKADTGATRLTPLAWTPTLLLLLSAALFVSGAGAYAAIRGVDLLNFGASLVPALFLTVGVAAVSAYFMPRTTIAVALVAGIFSVTLATTTSRDPSVFEENRVSTVTALANALVADVSLSSSFGSNLTIVHIDWGLPNDYFLGQTELILPGAIIEVLPIPRRKELDQVLLHIADQNPTDRILVITRMPVERYVLPEVPDGFSALVVNGSIVEMVRE